MNKFTNLNYGDLEALILYENKEAFASLINKDLYKVLGEKGTQVQLYNLSSLELFSIRLTEFLAERKVDIIGEAQHISIFTGSKLFIKNYPETPDTNSLHACTSKIEDWLNVTNEFKLWSGQKHVIFSLKRKK